MAEEHPQAPVVQLPQTLPSNVASSLAATVVETPAAQVENKKNTKPRKPNKRQLQQSTTTTPPALCVPIPIQALDDLAQASLDFTLESLAFQSGDVSATAMLTKRILFGPCRDLIRWLDSSALTSAEMVRWTQACVLVVQLGGNLDTLGNEHRPLSMFQNIDLLDLLGKAECLVEMLPHNLQERQVAVDRLHVLRRQVAASETMRRTFHSVWSLFYKPLDGHVNESIGSFYESAAHTFWCLMRRQCFDTCLDCETLLASQLAVIHILFVDFAHQVDVNTFDSASNSLGDWLVDYSPSAEQQQQQEQLGLYPIPNTILAICSKVPGVSEERIWQCWQRMSVCMGVRLKLAVLGRGIFCGDFNQSRSIVSALNMLYDSQFASRMLTVDERRAVVLLSSVDAATPPSQDLDQMVKARKDGCASWIARCLASKCKEEQLVATVAQRYGLPCDGELFHIVASVFSVQMDFIQPNVLQEDLVYALFACSLVLVSYFLPSAAAAAGQLDPSASCSSALDFFKAAKLILNKSTGLPQVLQARLQESMLSCVHRMGWRTQERTLHIDANNVGLGDGLFLAQAERESTLMLCAVLAGQGVIQDSVVNQAVALLRAVLRDSDLMQNRNLNCAVLCCAYATARFHSLYHVTFQSLADTLLLSSQKGGDEARRLSEQDIFVVDLSSGERGTVIDYYNLVFLPHSEALISTYLSVGDGDVDEKSSSGEWLSVRTALPNTLHPPKHNFTDKPKKSIGLGLNIRVWLLENRYQKDSVHKTFDPL